jgi:hypothetical protein
LYDDYSTIATIPTRISLDNLNCAPGVFDLSNFTLSVQLPHPVVVRRCTPPYRITDGLAQGSPLPYIQDHVTAQGSPSDLNDLVKSHLGPSHINTVRIDAVPPLWVPSPETGSSSLIGVLPRFEEYCWTKFNYSEPFTLSELFTDEYRDAKETCFEVLVCTISAYSSSSDIERLYNEGTSVAHVPSLLDVGFDLTHYDSLIIMDLSGISYLTIRISLLRSPASVV